jgi:hypothetical protein
VICKRMRSSLKLRVAGCLGRCVPAASEENEAKEEKKKKKKKKKKNARCRFWWLTCLLSLQAFTL